MSRFRPTAEDSPPRPTSTTPTTTPPRSVPTYLSPSPTRIPRPLATGSTSPRPRPHNPLSPSQLLDFTSPTIAHPPSPPDTVRSPSPPTRAGAGSPSRRGSVLSGEGVTERLSFPAAAMRDLAAEREGRGAQNGAGGVGYSFGGGSLRKGDSFGGGSAAGLGAARASTQPKLRKKWLVHVVPPEVLPHSPPPVQTSGFANGYGASGRFSEGILLPLQPTLGAQIALIAREFSLPSIGGVSLYLCLPSAASSSAPPSSTGYPFHPAGPPGGIAPALKPRLLEDTWSILWSSHFGEGEGEAEGMPGVMGLPLATRIEFDIDPRKARWLPAWTGQASSIPVPISTAGCPAALRTRPGGSISYKHSYSPTHSHHHSSSTVTEESSEPSHSRDASAELKVEPQHHPEEAAAHQQASLPARYPIARALSSPVVGSPSSRLSRGRRPLSLLVNRAIPHSSTATQHHIASPILNGTFGPVATSPSHLSHDKRQREIQPTARKLEDSGFGGSPEQHERAWPSTPQSPYRLPGPDIAHRSLASPSIEGEFRLHSPPARRSPANATTRAPSSLKLAPKLIERDWSVKILPLWQISGTPTPSTGRESATTEKQGSFDTAQEAIVQPSQFQSSIKYPVLDVYPPAYPHVDLYRPRQLQPTIIAPPLKLAQDSSSRGAYPFNLASIHPSVYPNLELYPSLPPRMPLRHAFDLSPSLPLPAYPSFANLYPPTYPHLVIYPSSLIRYIVSPICPAYPSPPKRKPPPIPIAAPLVLLHRSNSGSSSSSATSLSWPQTPPSPERLESATLMDRLIASGGIEEEGKWMGAQSQRVFCDDSEESGEEGDGGEMSYERARELVGRDWDVKVVSLQEASELSPTGMMMAEYGEQELTDEMQGMFGELVLEEHRRQDGFLSVDGSEFDSLSPPRPHRDISGHLTPPHSPSLPPVASPTLNAAALNRSRSSPPVSISSTVDSSQLSTPSHPDEVPFVLSPSFGAALGLLDSESGTTSEFPYADESSRERAETRSELEETSFPDGESDGDEYDGSVFEGRLGAGGFRFEDEDGETEGWATEQYLVLDSSGQGEDQSCMTFDHLSPIEPQPAVELFPAPVFFTFPPIAQSDDLASAVGQFIVEAQTQSILRRGRFTIALSGGCLPKILADALLGDDRVDWRRWEVFFADERLVPLDEPDSTFAIYDKLIFSRVPIPAWNVHTLKPLPELSEAQSVEKAAHKLAEDYEEQLLKSFPECGSGDGIAEPPRFDVVLLSMGEDGHCASLFPSHPLLAERDYWVSPVLLTPGTFSSRITFTFPVLSAARRLAFVCTGTEKSLALANALDMGLSQHDEEKVPAGRVTLKGHPIVWFVDEEAAHGVEYPRSEFWEE